MFRPENVPAVVAGVVLGFLAFFALLALLIFLVRKYGMPRPPTVIRRVIRRKKNPATPIPATMIDEPVAPTPTSAPTPAPTPNAGPNTSVKRHVVNIDYLMTGARRVVVKDGNPTAVKEVVEEPAPLVNPYTTPVPDDEEEIILEETVDGDDPCGWFTSMFKRRPEF